MLIAKAVFSFLKKNWKTVLIIAAVIYVILSIRSCNEKNQQIRDLKQVTENSVAIANSAIKHWKDDKNRMHAQVNNLQASYLAISHTLDSTSKLLGIKSRQIEAWSKTGFKIDLKATPEVKPYYVAVPCNDKDTIQVANRYDFEWQDQWLQVSGSVGDGIKELRVTGRDTLSRVDYWDRKWFLGAKTHYSDFSNANKHIELVSYRGAQIRHKDKKWNVSLALMYGYPVNNFRLNKPQVMFGVSGGYSLFNF